MARPLLPTPRGPITAWLTETLCAGPGALSDWPDPTGAPLRCDDEAMALYICYELHYRGFADVVDEWEWDPSLLRFRSMLEERFVSAVAAHVGGLPDPGARPAPDDVTSALDAVIARPGRSLSRHVADRGTWAQFQEFAMHRSAYQLKEADPHTWAIPRLHGDAKAALVAIQKDEYGEGDPDRVHAHLFSETLGAIGLSAEYGAHLDRLPGITLSTVNLISLFGLHRRWRGALVGHLAIFEMASVGPNGNYARALRQFGYGGEATTFYDAHVTADEYHQAVARNDLAARLARDEPDVAADIIFGAHAITAVEGMFADHLLDAWALGQSSLYGAESSEPPSSQGEERRPTIDTPMRRLVAEGGCDSSSRRRAGPATTRSHRG